MFPGAVVTPVARIPNRDVAAESWPPVPKFAVAEPVPEDVALNVGRVVPDATTAPQ